MIKVNQLSKSYGKQILFDNVCFSVEPKEHIGLIGRNGFGKTTLFKIILGLEEADNMNLEIPNDYKIGYLQQRLNFTKSTLLQEVCNQFTDIEKNEQWKAEKILLGLGFKKEQFDQAPSTFSGGFQIRINLAKLLVSDNDMFFLDEPTNYLDIVSIRWLESFLKSWQKEFILITHDRKFMDSVITHCMILHRYKLKKIKGNTSKLYQQIQMEEDVYEKTRVNEEKKKKKTELFISKFRAKARLGGLVQSRVKALEKQEIKEKLFKIKQIDFKFNYAEFNAKQMMSIENINFSYDKKNQIIKNFNLIIGNNERIGIIGPNGKGKTTLINLLAEELNADSGKIKKHENLKIGYYGQTNINRLNEENTILNELLYSDASVDNQKARDVCGSLLFEGDAALKKISVLSGGERSRVLLGKILVSNANMLLLDEPTNHLDIESCDAFLRALKKFEGTIIFVTHNEMYLEQLAEKLIVFDGENVSVYNNDYKTFIKDVGWQFETDNKQELKTQELENTSYTKKELRKLRSEIIVKWNIVLKPLEKIINKTEKEIEDSEKKLNKCYKKLTIASESGDAEKISKYSKISSYLDDKINSLYEILDKKIEEYEINKKKFDLEIKKYE